MENKIGPQDKKRKKRPEKNKSAVSEPVAKKQKKGITKDTAEPEFSHVRFKFLLRSSDTITEGLQTFLNISCKADDDTGDDDIERLLLLEAYLKSSPQCSEVLDLLASKLSPPQVSLVLTWIRHVLEECPKVMRSFADLQLHLVKTLLTKHYNLLMNTVRRGSKSSHAKATLLLLLTVAAIGHKYAKMLQLHLDFNHENWLHLVTQRNRKDETDVRACMSALLMKLLQVDDDELTRSLVDQKVLLQEVLSGLKYDQSEYIIANLKTIHRYIVLNKKVGKNAKLYLFNSQVLKELLVLYQWLGPKYWKQQPTEQEKLEYSEEQRAVAEAIHPVLVDLLANHKLGICFRDKSMGMSAENKNRTLSKVLQLLVTSFTAPMSHRLVTAILTTCPDQLHSFLLLLQPYLAPRPIDTWVTCLQFFLQIMETVAWPSTVMEDMQTATEEKVSQFAHLLFPPDGIITALKDGLKHECATVRQLCLQALELIASRGQHFRDISRNKFGENAPLSLCIEGIVLKVLPNEQVLLNLLKRFSAKQSFSVPITRDLYKDTDVPLQHVSCFQHLVTILRMYSLAPEHLTGGLAETLPLLLQLVEQVGVARDDAETGYSPPKGMSSSLPALCLLQALSQCDVRKLTLFGKGGTKGDLTQTLVYQLVHLMQAQGDDQGCSQTALSLIAKLLAGTGLFEGHQRELSIWLHHLTDADSAPQEVVTYFVGLLRQYIPNPYPAIDRLLEQVEEAPRLIDGQYLPYVRLEFSPLVMFALSGDFHKHEKVHHYLCNVLIDILHSLHNPCSFSRLVHSLASNLDPEVTQYLTFHTAEEEATTDSIMKRTCKKVRLKQIKSSGKHRGVSLMKKVLKGAGEVTALVEALSPSDCLSLVHQSLRYVEEVVTASVKNMGELLNKELVEVCMEILQVTSLRLAAGPVHNTVKGDNSAKTKDDTITHETDNSNSEMEVSNDADRVRTKQPQGGKGKASDDSDSSEADDVAMDSDDEDDDEADDKVNNDETNIPTHSTAREETEISAPGRYCVSLSKALVAGGKSDLMDLSKLATDWIQEVTVSILNHPLVSQWLFVEGFKQSGTPTEWIVGQLCDIIRDLMQVRDSSADHKAPVSYVSEKFCGMVQAASSSGSGKVQKKLQPLLCRCLETLTVVGGCSLHLEALMMLVSLPLESFLSASSQTPTPLAHMLFRFADSVRLDAKAVKELKSRQDISSSFEGLFHLISALDSPQLESLALSCVQSISQLCLACTEEAFGGLLNKLGAEVSPDLQALVETVMANNSQCRMLCSSWLKKKKKEMKTRKLEFAPIMLMYLRLALKTNVTAEDDAGVHAITEAVRHILEKETLDVDEVNTPFLHVICHLVNCNVIDLTAMHKLQSSIMLQANRNPCLLEAHVQLLAAVLRQQALHACGLDDDIDEFDPILHDLDPRTDDDPVSSDLDPGSNDLGKKWSTFEEQAGRTLMGCLRCLISEQVMVEEETKGLRAKLILLCQGLLSLPIQQTVKDDIIKLWPSIVNSCLKYHFKDASYVSLLQHLVQHIGIGEKQLDEPRDIITDDAVDNDDFNTNRRVSDSDTSDGEENEDDPDSTKQKTSSRTKSHSLAWKKLTSKQPAKHFSAVVTKTAKRLGLTKTSEVARKCLTLFGEEGNSKSCVATFSNTRAEMVNSWTGRGRLWRKSFFPWPEQGTSPVPHAQKPSPHEALWVDLCERCIGHTAFFPIMLGSELEAVKQELVSLLACLVRLAPKCCWVLPLNTLLAAYGATLSLTDQNLLYLMLSCDVHGNQRLKPGVWGEKAVERLEMKQQMGKSLLYETSLTNILELIDPDVMATSILHFPLMRTMKYQPMECAVNAVRMMSKDGCYDPRFLLQVFFHFMGPEHIVDVRAFMAHKGLGYTLSALSSHDTFTRELAIGILSNLHSHIELNARWSSAPILLAFLKVIMNGITSEGQKLPSVITIFVAKAAELFTTPGDDMYVPIYSFLNLKAGMDIGNVPEFYQFFNSPKPKERLWILQHLQDGLRETSDHVLFQRRYVYKLVMCYANSSLCDHQTRRELLKVLVKASSIATVAKYLVTKHALLSWLVSFIKDTLPDTAEPTQLVCQLLHNLCYTTEFNSRRLWWLSMSYLSRQCLLHVPQCVCLRLLLLNFSHLEVNSLEMLLDVLQHPYIIPSSPSTLLPLVVLATWHLAHHRMDIEMTSTAANLAQSLGFDLPAATGAKPQQRKVSPVVEEGKYMERSEAGRKKAEKVSELKKRLWSLLSGLDTQEQPSLLVGGSREATKMSVEDVVAKLQACLSR